MPDTAPPTTASPAGSRTTVFNPIVAFLTRHGVSVWGSRVLEVRGRKTGEPRRTAGQPADARRPPVPRLAPWRGASGCATCAAGDGRLATLVGRRREEWVAHELDDADKVPVLRAYLARWKAEVGVFFDGASADSTDDELAAIAPRHPVFALERGRRRRMSRRPARRPAGPASPPPRRARAHAAGGRGVAAARRRLDRDGLDGLTMRSVAEELHIKAPSLYKHVAGKGAIEVELIDRRAGRDGRGPPPRGRRPRRRPRSADLLAAYRRARPRPAQPLPPGHRGPSCPATSCLPGLEDWAGEPFLPRDRRRPTWPRRCGRSPTAWWSSRSTAASPTPDLDRPGRRAPPPSREPPLAAAVAATRRRTTEVVMPTRTPRPPAPGRVAVPAPRRRRTDLAALPPLHGTERRRIAPGPDHSESRRLSDTLTALSAAGSERTPLADSAPGGGRAPPPDRTDSGEQQPAAGAQGGQRGQAEQRHPHRAGHAGEPGQDVGVGGRPRLVAPLRAAARRPAARRRAAGTRSSRRRTRPARRPRRTARRRPPRRRSRPATARRTSCAP